MHNRPNRQNGDWVSRHGRVYSDRKLISGFFFRLAKWQSGSLMAAGQRDGALWRWWSLTSLWTPTALQILPRHVNSTEESAAGPIKFSRGIWETFAVSWGMQVLMENAGPADRNAISTHCQSIIQSSFLFMSFPGGRSFHFERVQLTLLITFGGLEVSIVPIQTVLVKYRTFKQN